MSLKSTIATICHLSLLAPLFFSYAASAQERAGPPAADQAPIALLVDMNSGQTLFSRDADRRFVPASITKVMTASLAFDLLENGALRLDQAMTVRPDTFRDWSGVGSTMFLPHDARVTVDQLLHGITTVSANDASVVLGEGAAGSLDHWTRLMNENAAKIGMFDSRFGTPNGWPDDARTYTTAGDLVRLAEDLIRRHPAKYAHFFGQPRYRFNNITQNNHDPFVGKVPGGDGLKTGFTNQAGYGFLGSVERDGRRLIVVVAGADSAYSRNKAAVQLVEWGFSAFQPRTLFDANSVVAAAKVQGGAKPSVGLRTDQAVIWSGRPGSETSPNVSIEYDGPLSAPLEADTPVAQMALTMPDGSVSRVPLYAAETIAAGNWFDRLLSGFARWLA